MMNIFAFFCYLYDGFDSRRFWRGCWKVVSFPFKALGYIFLFILKLIGEIL